MAIESSDEARRAAEAMIADVASGNLSAAEFVTLYSDDDLLWIGRFLAPALTDAINRWRAGVASPDTIRLVEFARQVQVDRDAAHLDLAAAKAERAAERRAATVVAIQPAPDIVDQMTGVGLHGIPLPVDAEPEAEGGFMSTRVAAPEALMAFYIEHMRATGWTLDLNNSNPITKVGPSKSPNGDEPFVMPPQCYFTRPDLPDRYVQVIVSASVEAPTITRLLISEHEN